MKTGIFCKALEILSHTNYYQVVKERVTINVDQYHDMLRKKHMLCQEHSPPM